MAQQASKIRRLHLPLTFLWHTQGPAVLVLFAPVKRQKTK
jgi:hypothetical protein